MRRRRACRVGRVRPGAADAGGGRDRRTATRPWQEPAGGGAVVARQIARLAGRCEFFTALGDDDLGRARRGASPSSGRRPRPVRRQDAARLGARRRRRRADDHRARRQAAAARAAAARRATTLVFFVSGERRGAALRASRPLPRGDAARAADAPRRRASGSTCSSAARATRASSSTARSRRDDGRADRGRAGGTANGERYAAAPLPGPVVDTYGAGDSFAAALCFALARGDELAGRARARGARGRRRRHRGRAVRDAASVPDDAARVSWITIAPVRRSRCSRSTRSS